VCLGFQTARPPLDAIDTVTGAHLLRITCSALSSAVMVAGVRPSCALSA
jgi:hypothetical protein